MPDTLYLKQLECGPMHNYVYLIGDPATRQAVVVDPAWDVDDSTILYPGHNYARQSTSTIGAERQQNPYVQHTSLHAFLHAMGR